MGKIRVQWYIAAVRYSCRRVLRKPLYTGNTSFISRSISVATARWWHKFFFQREEPVAVVAIFEFSSTCRRKRRAQEERRSLNPFVGHQCSFSRKIQRRIKGLAFLRVLSSHVICRAIHAPSASQINARIPPLSCFLNIRRGAPRRIREKSLARPRKRNYREKMSPGVLIKSQRK